MSAGVFGSDRGPIAAAGNMIGVTVSANTSQPLPFSSTAVITLRELATVATSGVAII